jgi:hypothetical protein
MSQDRELERWWASLTDAERAAVIEAVRSRKITEEWWARLAAKGLPLSAQPIDEGEWDFAVLTPEFRDFIARMAAS